MIYLKCLTQHLILYEISKKGNRKATDFEKLFNLWKYIQINELEN